MLWIAFAVVHVGVAWLGYLMPNQPMGDVYLVYESWSRQALDARGIVGVTEGWVYPQLALVPMVLAHAFAWITDYTLGWTILVTFANALGFALLVGRGRSTSRTVAAWFWLAYLAVLGPIGMYRIDAITVPIAIAGLLWIVHRPWLGATLLAIGAWIKIWPAALIAAAFVAVRRRGPVLGAAAIAIAAVTGVVALAGGGAHLLSFVTEQNGRGLQLEAPISMAYLWQAMAGVPGAYVFYDTDILTFQVTGANVDAVIAAMTPLMALAAVGVFALGAVKAWRGASFVALFPSLALGLVLTLIVFNKVGSPQFMSWLIAPLAVWLVLDRHRAWPLAVTGLVIAALTQAVYPVAYHLVLAAHPAGVALLSARNLLLVALLVWTVVLLARVPVVRRERSVRAAESGAAVPGDAAETD